MFLKFYDKSGIYPESVPIDCEVDTFRDVLTKICAVAKYKALVTKDDDLLVVTAGLPFVGTPGLANTIRIITASGPASWSLPSDGIMDLSGH